MVGLTLAGRPGDPTSDDNWYPGDWMDVERAEQLLSFQHHSWPDMLEEMRARAGWTRYPMRLATPLVRAILKAERPTAMRRAQYADPWGAIRAKLGEPRPDYWPKPQ